MKLMKLICITVVMVLSILSCNNSKKNTERIDEFKKAKKLLIPIKNKENFTDNFQVEIIAKVKSSDNFQLFYTENYMLQYSDQNKITTYVEGKDSFQSIIFNLPKHVYPERYRFDVGSNRKLKEIEIKSLTIRIDQEQIVIPQEFLSDYIVPNNYINQEGKVYKLRTIEKNGEIYYDPFFTCSPKFIRLLELL